jgi:hypothetical protein
MEVFPMLSFSVEAAGATEILGFEAVPSNGQ